MHNVRIVEEKTQHFNLCLIDFKEYGNYIDVLNAYKEDNEVFEGECVYIKHNDCFAYINECEKYIELKVLK